MNFREDMVNGVVVDMDCFYSDRIETKNVDRHILTNNEKYRAIINVLPHEYQGPCKKESTMPRKRSKSL